GVVTARAAGSATITATAGGQSASSAITVTAPEPEPEPEPEPDPDPVPPPPSSDVTPVVVEDFSTYTSTSHMLSDPRGIYVPSEDIRTQHINFDTNIGYGGSRGSMRYDYPQLGSVSEDYTISRSIDIRPE